MSQKGGKNYKLKYPFSIAGKEYAEINLSRPKGKDIKGLDFKNISTKECGDLAYAISDWDTPKAFDEMDAADYLEVTELALSFLADGRATGETR